MKGEEAMLLGEILFKGISSTVYGLKLNYNSIPILPEKRSKTEYVIGKNGGYTFTDGFKNRTVEIEFLLTGKLLQRRAKLNDIAAWLSGSGELILGIDSGIMYEAKVIGGVIPELTFHSDRFVVTFDCKPIKKQRAENSELTWDMVETPWNDVNLLWDGYSTQFTVTAPGTVPLDNMGTYTSLPLIILSGTASTITLTDSKGNAITYTGLVNGTPVYIDCEESVVYSLNGTTPVNQMNNFSEASDKYFFELVAGSNAITINGTDLNLTVEFKYRNAFI
jgi:phage-related protein